MHDNLSDLHREIAADMRWRRDTEFKLLTVHFAVVGASLALMFQAQGKTAVIEIIASSVVLIAVTAFWLLARDKIQKEHQVHIYLGGRIVKIWERWKFFESVEKNGVVAPPVLEERSRGFGSGEGYKATLRLMLTSWLLSVFVAVLLLILAVGELCEEKHKQPNKALEPTTMAVTPPAAQESRQP